MIFEWGERLIDWGLKTARHNTNAQCLKLIEESIERYTPDLIVIQDHVEKGSRRCRRVKVLLRKIERLATEKHIECRLISRMDVRELFTRSDATNKHQIATTIVTRLPELAPWLPRPRKPWMSEDSRMSIFAAAALALTFLSVKGAKINLRCGE